MGDLDSSLGRFAYEVVIRLPTRQLNTFCQMKDVRGSHKALREGKGFQSKTEGLQALLHFNRDELQDRILPQTR